MITAYKNPNNGKYVVIVVIAWTIPWFLGCESPPPIFFLTCKSVYKFLCICNTYINCRSFKNFSEENLIIESIYFYYYSLLSPFLVMDVVARALSNIIVKLKNFTHKAVVMRPILVYYKNAALFHFWELTLECIELCLSLFSIILPPHPEKSCHSVNTSLQPNCNMYTWYAKWAILF